MNDDTIMNVIEHVRTHFYGKYSGTVTDVNDGQHMGRIKAKVPSVLCERETGWCMPCVPYAGDGVGFAVLPEVGSGVWIEFEGGLTSSPIWSGCYWRLGELPSDVEPAVKTIVTKAGHKILLDDNASSITIRDSHDNTITLDASGITLERHGQKIVVSDEAVNVNDGALEVM